MDSLSVSPDEGALVDASTDAPMSAFGPSSEEAKLARLARKAESARQARLRHKDHVYQLSEEVKALRAELARREHNQAVWQQQLRRELQEALPADRWQQLEGWLAASALSQQQQQQQQQQQRVAPAYSVEDEPPPEMLLCALSMGTPTLRPLAEVPAGRVQAMHARGVRSRRASAVASHRNLPPQPAAAGGSKPPDLLDVASRPAANLAVPTPPATACTTTRLKAADELRFKTSPSTVMSEELAAAALGIFGLSGSSK